METRAQNKYNFPQNDRGLVLGTFSSKIICPGTICSLGKENNGNKLSETPSLIHPSLISPVCWRVDDLSLASHRIGHWQSQKGAPHIGSSKIACGLPGLEQMEPCGRAQLLLLKQFHFLQKRCWQWGYFGFGPYLGKMSRTRAARIAFFSQDQVFA